MGAAQRIAQQHKQIYLVAQNQYIEYCMRPSNVVELRRSGMFYTYFLSVPHSIRAQRFRAHPITQLLEEVGIKDAGLHQPWFAPQSEDSAQDVPVHDFIIAPFSNSSDRRMPDRTLSGLVMRLRMQFAGTSTAIVCSDADIHQSVLMHLEQFAMIYAGYELRWVLELMRAARIAVITADSGPSRLAHCGKLRKHVICTPPTYPVHWTGYPGADVVQSWDLAPILERLT
jgi:ADP-heptose:LPS heptosyltransferase